MESFLRYVAHDLYDQVGGDFQNVTVVFPNKRASLFFNKHLQEKAEGRTMWSPRYITISELFASMTNVLVGDPVFLISQLHEVYRRHFPTDERTFDDLYPLLEMMLADFQDVDSNMVPAEKLLRNVKELQDMNDYSFLQPEQIQAIQHFFNGLDWLNGTNEQRKFVTLWDKLLDIYNDYRELLLTADEPMVYEGMMKRMVAEAAGKGQGDFVKSQTSALKGLYAFIGFNVLNRTEHELFKFIKQNCEALFYWDYDVAFMKEMDAAQSSGSGADAASSRSGLSFPGTFISENIRDFGSALPADAPIYNIMSATPKKITFAESPTENAQARYLNTWVGEMSLDNLTENAVVLCNESLLEPVLHSIPNREGLSLNVTMGYPLTDTPAFSLVQALMELQLRGRSRSGAWRYKQVAAVLKHPYIKRITNGTSSSTLSLLTKENIIFPTDDTFASDPLLSIVFKKHAGKELTAYVAHVLSMAANQTFSGWDGALFQESIFAAYTTVNRLHAMQCSIASLAELSDQTIVRLLYQSLQRVTVPFHGEPAEGLQVMGFLETRNLDFRNVVLLSADDAQMPRASKRPSLIPYTLQAAFGMTTIEKEVSIYAYYFYRLIARAENITVMWNASTEDGHKGEMSQFMMQLLYETPRFFHHDQRIEIKKVITPMATSKAERLVVEKNDEIVKRLRLRFNAERGLTPSALNCYLRCQLQFFFRYVACLRPDDEVSEDINDAIFGNIFHYVMEQLYLPYVKPVPKPIASSQLQAMAKDEATLSRLVNEGFSLMLYKDKVPKAVTLSGAQLIKHHVLRSLLKMQLLADARTAEEAERTGGNLTVLALEEPHYVNREIAIDGCDEPLTVRLGGIIDRIDKVDNAVQQTIRIVDYKTSANPQKAQCISDLFDPAKASKNYHITQTLYYCDVLCEDGAYNANTLPVVPAIMYYKTNLKGESPVVHISAGEKMKKRPCIESYTDDCKDTFHPLMENAIASIFSPTGSFSACEDEHNCTFCDFRDLCRKTAKKKLF